jgi:hypothetical protein
MSFYAITSLYKATPVMRCVHRAAADEHGCMRVVEMKVKKGEIEKGERIASSNPRKYSENNESHGQIHVNPHKPWLGI